jgi:hypothetical protein
MKSKKPEIEETKTCTFNMPLRIHRSLKWAAVQKDSTMGKIITQALEEYFSKKKAEK